MGAVLATLLMRLEAPPVEPDEGVPLPPVLHRVVTEEDIAGREVLIIGDVHGCYDELQLLIEQESIQFDKTLLVSCGDLINKGPKNVQTLQFFRKTNALLVRGNHEEHVIKNYFKLKQESQNGVTSGGTVPEKYKWIAGLEKGDIDFLVQLPYTISIPSLKTIVVHAGLHPWKPLQHQLPTDMTLMRNIVGIDGTEVKMTKLTSDGCAWAPHWGGPEHVYFGHDARRGLQVHKFASGLDTGCLYGRNLTGIYINGPKQGQYVTVQAKQAYRIPKNLRSMEAKGVKSG